RPGWRGKACCPTCCGRPCRAPAPPWPSNWRWRWPRWIASSPRRPWRREARRPGAAWREAGGLLMMRPSWAAPAGASDFHGACFPIAFGLAGDGRGPAVLRRHLPAVRRGHLAVDAPRAAGPGHRRRAGSAPARAGPAAARTDAVRRLGADLRPGHDLPLGATAAGLGAAGPGRRRRPHRAGDPGAGGLERRALLDQSPAAAYPPAAPLPPAAPPLRGDHAVFHLQFPSGRGADAGQRDPAAHGAARLQLLVAVLGAAVQPVLQLRGARQLRFLPARVVRALVRRQPPASSASRLLSRQLRVPVHLHGPPVPHAAAGRCRGGPAGARPGGEGRLSAASGPPARRPRALRHWRDAQSLAYMAALPALAAWQWVHGVHALLYGLMLFLTLGVGVIHHNHTHLRMWRRRWAN